MRIHKPKNNWSRKAGVPLNPVQMGGQCAETDEVLRWADAQGLQRLRILHFGQYDWTLENRRPFKVAVLFSDQPRDAMTIQIVTKPDQKALHIPCSTTYAFTLQLLREYPQLQPILKEGVNLIWAHWSKWPATELSTRVNAFFGNVKAFQPLWAQKQPTGLVLSLPQSATAHLNDIRAALEENAKNQHLRVVIETRMVAHCPLLCILVQRALPNPDQQQPVTAATTTQSAPMPTAPASVSTPSPAPAPTPNPQDEFQRLLKGIVGVVRVANRGVQESDIAGCYPASGDKEQWAHQIITRFLSGRSQHENFAKKLIVRTLVPGVTVEELLKCQGPAQPNSPKPTTPRKPGRPRKNASQPAAAPQPSAAAPQAAPQAVPSTPTSASGSPAPVQSPAESGEAPVAADIAQQSDAHPVEPMAPAPSEPAPEPAPPPMPAPVSAPTPAAAPPSAPSTGIVRPRANSGDILGGPSCPSPERDAHNREIRGRLEQVTNSMDAARNRLDTINRSIFELQTRLREALDASADVQESLHRMDSERQRIVDELNGPKPIS